MPIILFITFLVLAVFVIIFWRRFTFTQRKIEWLHSQKFILLRILVPKNNEKTPLAAEQMFAALHGIFRPDFPFQNHLSFEIAAKEKYIQFYVYVPINLKDFVEGQIYSQYPTAEISEIEDYTDLDMAQVYVSGTELVLNKEDVFPIKTFLNFEVDPLSGITGVLSKVSASDQIWIQILVRPVSDEWQKKGQIYTENIHSGKASGGGLFGRALRAFGSFLGAIISSAATTTPTELGKTGSEVKLSSSVETALKGVEEKSAKLGFETRIRILAVSSDEQTARGQVLAAVGSFKQFNTTNLNGFAAGPMMRGKEFLNLYRSRNFEDKGNIFNIEELASIFHLPNITVETPSIVWAGSKKGEPPSNLPIENTVTPLDLTIFAKTDFRHRSEKFGIKTKDRRLHMYLIGKTGTGKSTTLENMIMDDIKEGKGVAVVDPHGDLIKHILDRVPDHRVSDVILFDPSDRDYPVGFNVLEAVDPDLKNIIASGVVGIFKKIFGESWGPRLEYILRNTILALLDYPDATLLGVMKILVDKEYRHKVISEIQDPIIRDFFINEYEKYDPKFRTEAIAPIQNKVGQFLSSSTIRNIVGQPKSTINIEEIMDNKKILLLDLSIGKIGEDSSALLGAMLITKIQLAAMQRTKIPEEERIDFYLYVDEFQNFATESFAVILSEARKYRLNLIMTNQYIAQMPEIVADAIFGNVGTIITYRVGATDASFLVKEFAPVFEENDLVNLDNYHIYSKMAIDGVTMPAFSATTLPPGKEKTDNKGQILSISRQSYGKVRTEVEEKIAKEASSVTMLVESEKEARQQSYKVNLEPQIAKVGERTFEKYDFGGKTWYMEVKSASSADRGEKVPREPAKVVGEAAKKEEVSKTKEQASLKRTIGFQLPSKIEIQKPKIEDRGYTKLEQGKTIKL